MLRIELPEISFEIAGMHPEVAEVCNELKGSPDIRPELLILALSLPDPNFPARERFISKFFEWLASNYLCSKLKPNELLLNPDDTHTIFEQSLLRARLANKRAKRPDGLIFLPDGRRTLLTGVAEYSITGGIENGKRAQRTYFRNGKVAKDLLPDRNIAWRQQLGTILNGFSSRLPRLVEFDPNNFRSIFVLLEGTGFKPMNGEELVRIRSSRTELEIVTDQVIKCLSIGR